MLHGLLDSTRVILPPLYHFFNDMADSPLLSTSASLAFAFSILLLTVLIVFILDICHSILSVHKSIDMQQSQIFNPDM